MSLRVVALGTATLAVLARLPYLALPATPDEGGFLLVGSQWHPGTSLYGDHWVDRPPLLIAVHALAAALGGVVALRVIGLVAVVATVLLTAALVDAVAPDGAARGRVTAARAIPVLGVAVLLASPLLGSSEVSGELLYAPFVVGGLVALVRAWTASGRRGAVGWAFIAGATGLAAVAVKQNAVDVFVAAGVLTLLALLTRADAVRRRRALEVAAAGCMGAVLALVAVLAVAASRGTTPTALLDAVVTFRFQAGEVIRTSSNGAEDGRAVRLIHASLASGLVPLVLAMARRVRGPIRAADVDAPRRGTAPDLRWAAGAVLVWETVAVTAGGSYWLHYLLVLVPGLALLGAAAAQPRARSQPRGSALLAPAALAVALAAALTGLLTTSGLGPARASDARVAAYLASVARPGDTASVAFGHPDIVWEAGLRSPSEQLWSLPVRVRDPRLVDFSAMLTSPAAPTWLVVHGTGLGGWGLHPARAERLLRTLYTDVAREGDWTVWRRA